MAEGLMLALSEPSLPVKSTSDTTRTTEAQNCPLDFLFKMRLRKPVSHAASGQLKDVARGRQTEGANRNH